MPRDYYEILGVEKTAIAIGKDDITIPRHLMTGEKHKGIITDGKTVEEWYWEGFCSIEETRYIYFAPLDVMTVEALSDELRDRALEIVRTIAFGLMNAGPSFLDITNGVFPLSRILLLRDGRVLLLPPDLGDIISITQSEEENRRDYTDIIRGNAEVQFRLITEMAELMYFAATGIFPYASDSIRGSGYNPVPVSFLETLDEKTDGFITFVLSAKSKETRDIMGNSLDGKNLAWFLDRTYNLEWGLPARKKEDTEKAVAASLATADVRAYMENAEKKTRRNSFWRVKGTIITVSVIAAVLVLSFLGNWIYRILQPPVTAGLDEREIIEAFYDAQNDLDTQLLTDAVKGCKIPQEMEVTNLYVTSRARVAYEGMNFVVNAEDWVNAGMPPIAESAIIYGVVLESIEQADEDTFIATGIWYSPYPGSEDEPQTGYVYKYRIRQSFDFKWNDRGWWNITGSEILSRENLGSDPVTYVPLSDVRQGG